MVLEWNHLRGYFWARLAAEVIILQLNVTVGDAHGKEVQTVRTGSGGDIAGLGLGALPRDQIAEVVGRYPRLGLKGRLRPRRVDEGPGTDVS